MVQRAALVLALAAALALGAAPAAMAASHTGYGDTGWQHYDKRSCCQNAVWLAQDDSMVRCEMAGGVPRAPSSTSRGLCDWDASGGGNDRVYRCTAEASVHCR